MQPKRLLNHLVFTHEPQRDQSKIKKLENTNNTYLYKGE